MEKTDLKKILSVSGQPGLFRYIAQANAGIVVESIITGKRSMFGINAKVTSMSDISIYAQEGEIALRELFDKMITYLSGEDAPEAKSSPDNLRKFFEDVFPDYDRDRFYFSHMKKVVEWYNLLKKHASLDFETENEDTESKEE